MKEDARNAIVGIGSPLLGVISSYQEQWEWWFRFGGLVVGFLVGLLTLVSVIRKLLQKQP